VNTNDTHLFTDRHLAQQPRPLLNVPEVTPEKFSMSMS